MIATNMTDESNVISRLGKFCFVLAGAGEGTWSRRIQPLDAGRMTGTPIDQVV